MTLRDAQTRAPHPSMCGLCVRVYLNLHRPGFLSVQAASGPQKGRVIAHTRAVCLADCRFVVSAAGRARVLREHAKNVHAFIEGALRDIALLAEPLDRFQQLALGLEDQVAGIRYNPYETPSFQRRADASPVFRAASVLAIGGRVLELSKPCI